MLMADSDMTQTANAAVARVAQRVREREGAASGGGLETRSVYALEAIALELSLIRRSAETSDEELEIAGVIALAGARDALVKELNKLRYRKIAFDGMDTMLTRAVSLDSMARAVERVLGPLPAPIEGVPADSSEE